jgi:hypothetical protein
MNITDICNHIYNIYTSCFPHLNPSSPCPATTISLSIPYAKHCEYQGFEYTQVVPATQVPDPVHPSPAHCDHSGSVPPDDPVLVDVAEELVAVPVDTVPPKKLMTEVYAGLVVRSEFQRQASPSPEKVLGIHEYSSV